MEGWKLNKVMHFAQGTTPMCKAGRSRGTFRDTDVLVPATILSQFICPRAHTFLGKGCRCDFSDHSAHHRSLQAFPTAPQEVPQQNQPAEAWEEECRGS